MPQAPLRRGKPAAHHARRIGNTDAGQAGAERARPIRPPDREGAKHTIFNTHAHAGLCLAGRTYGTVRVMPKSALRDDGSRPHPITIDADAEVMDMVASLMPTSGTDRLTVEAGGDSVRKINMILREYPMDVRGTHMWNDLLVDMGKKKRIEQSTSRLEPVTPAPRRFKGTLLPFQKLGLDFILKTDGTALVADEMGLGKTVQTLAFVAQRPECLPAVVVAPLVTLENWKREILRFLRLDAEKGPRMPEIRIIRAGKAGALEPADFYLINYELVHKRIGDIMTANPRLVVFDEIQNIRNSDTYKTHSCARLAGHGSVRHRIGLSGTPIYNRGEEIYGMTEVIMPGIFGTKEQFTQMFYEMEDDYGYAVPVFKEDRLSKFLQKRVMIRRKKKEVLADLPDKSRLQQEVSIDSGMYKSKVREMYAQIAEAKKELEAHKTEEERKARLAELNKRILEMRVRERQAAGLAKAPYIAEYMAEMLDDYEDEKFVVFCHHKTVHKILYDGLWRFNPAQIIGGQSDQARQEAIDRFQGSLDCRVIICGLRAGNLGINLTKASYVIFAELDWSPAIHRQAEDRLHRIGQKSAVFAHYLVGLGTFDEYIVSVLVSKSAEIDAALGDTSEETNNRKALELLEAKFGKGSGLISEGIRHGSA